MVGVALLARIRVLRAQPPPKAALTDKVKAAGVITENPGLSRRTSARMTVGRAIAPNAPHTAVRRKDKPIIVP